MEAEVISIGDELTSGQRLDTNTQWLSKSLGELGFKTVRHTTVGDDLLQNISALRGAAERVDVVVITGGLGPTLDDLTRQAMAEAFGLALELDPVSLARIEAMFASRGREMPERNRLQAMFPSGSRIVPNPHGTAPGIDLQVESPKCRLFALPGVPAEMMQMWRETIVPRLDALRGGGLPPLRFYSLKAFGIGESDVEVRLPNLIARDRLPTVGITVSQATITLRIAGRAESQEQFMDEIQPTIAEIRHALGDLVFGEGDATLQRVVAQELRSRGATLAVVEIGSSSLVADWLASEAGREDTFFAGGVALPNSHVARRWFSLGVPESGESSFADCTGIATEPDDLLHRYTAYVKSRFQADYALLVSGYPTAAEMQVGGGSFNIEIRLVCPNGSHTKSLSLGGHPDVLPARIAKFGLDLLRRELT